MKSATLSEWTPQRISTRPSGGASDAILSMFSLLDFSIVLFLPISIHDKGDDF
jgi:hypothetical protein